jgi:pyridoxamine 5'-phosphate oxidase
MPMAPDPFDQFADWYAGVVDAAMCVATASPDGEPGARIVLLEGFDRQGFRFFTSYESAKGHHLEANPRAALLWYWPPDRQVRAGGAVKRVSTAESDAYWERRPRGHQLSASGSLQSSVVESREVLEDRVAARTASFEGQDIPRPESWGGYRVVPEWIEFWHHRDDRLHDRWRYRLVGGEWTIERLAP